VVVALGNTLTLPEGAGTPRLRLLMPLSITMEVAPLVTQFNVADPPDGMLAGETYRAATGREPEGGGAAATTSTCVLKVLP